MLELVKNHLPEILGALLCVSEGLSLLFPSSSGAGGIIQAMIKILKALGAKGQPKV